jgi:squalene-hopene/tetraprenyl-beta-curcumene cyclase
MVFACSKSKGNYSEYAKEGLPTAGTTHPAANDTKRASTWNQAAAAAYLDQRESWWIQWNAAKRDGDTFCVSCHTNLPYVFVQTALSQQLNSKTMTDEEKDLLSDVRERVKRWNSVDSYYGNKEDASGNGPWSRATEAVLNAAILAFEDSKTGQFSEDTQLAFKNMWALQLTSGSQEGAWQWQKFRLSPWESSESPYYGATLAALAVGVAPQSYRSSPEIQNNLAALRKYLDREYSDQSLLNRIGLLWASSRLPGLLTPERQESIVKEIYQKQQTDGGWSLVSLTWSPKYLGIPSILTVRRRNDWTPQETASDGLATGYISFVLQQAGELRQNPRLQSAITWLIRNQNQPEGYWSAYSLNRRRDPTTDVGRFMTDAATAFAVLALNGTEAGS